MKNKILIASANPWSFCLAVERALIHRHENDEVDAIDLFRLAAAESPHWSTRDKFIESVNRKYRRFIVPKINGRDITSMINVDMASIPAPPTDVRDIRAYRVGKARIGLGVLSSVVETTTIVEAKSSVEYGPDFGSAWRSAHLSAQVGEQVRRLGYDRVYIFGGRHCYARPFCDLLEEAGPVVKYEQGSSGTKFVETEASVYDERSVRPIVDAHVYDPVAGEAFFRERLERAPESDATFFTGMQQSGHLPDGAKDGNFVAFFTTSPDEMYASRERYHFGSFQNQHEAVLAIAESCRRRDLTLIVRFHPHLRYKHDSWQREWNFDELASAGVVVLRPEDPCDSYALLREARCTLGCSSTMGFEATYLGKPNAGIGDLWSTALGASTRVADAAEVDAFVENPRVPPDALERALRFGSFMRVGGTPVTELEVGEHANFAKIADRTVDPVRAAAQGIRNRWAGLRGRPLPNKAGIIAGRVVLPSGPRYEAMRERA